MPTEKRFVVDNMLGKVAKWLRALGFEACAVHLKDVQQLDQYARRGYHLVTRNTRLAGHPATLRVTSDDPREQLQQIIAVLGITPDEVHLLCRCLRCDEPLQPADRALVAGQVPDYVYENCSVFHQCPQCRQVYWAGSHLPRMHEWLHATLGWKFPSVVQGGSP
jgi:uncharacterized protein